MMILQKTFPKFHHISKMHITRMCSESVNIKQSKKHFEEGISLRAQRKRRAFALYIKNHKDDKVWKNVVDCGCETSYYIENGLRKVYPYYFSFGSFIKGRWIGKTVMEVFKSDFHREGVDPEREFNSGKITVNGKKVPKDFVVRHAMWMEHRCHRHEMPVLDVPIDIIDDTEEVLVINKPASIPVHPCGRYRYNSITMLLKHEYGYDNLRNLYRLDRLASGVLIFPKTTSVSKKLEKQLRYKEFYKEYVCRVIGKFPDGEVVCTEPLCRMPSTIALSKVDPNGKESSTTFTRLSYNGKSSVVKCVPHTGRTHQIRVHLQFLGHPICNDPLYNHPSFGPDRGKGGSFEKSDQEIANEIAKTSNIGIWKIGDNPRYFEKFGDKSAIDISISSDTDKSTCSTINIFEDITESDTVNLEEKEMSVAGGTSTVSESELPCKRVKLEDGLTMCSASSEASEIDIIKTDRTKNGGNIFNTLLNNNIHVQTYRKNLGTSQNIRTENSEQCDKVTLNKVSSERKVKQEDSGITEQPEMVGKVTDAELVESKLTVDEDCVECKYLYQDPKPEELIIYLHAVRYRGPSFDYSAPLPDWAREDFKEEHFTVT